MLEQSYQVLALVWKQVEWRYFAWRDIQIRLVGDHDPKVQQAADSLVAALDAQKDKDAEQQYVAARPAADALRIDPPHQLNGGRL